jgi:branched-chain amino acid transport system substrate-binding protein
MSIELRPLWRGAFTLILALIVSGTGLIRADVEPIKIGEIEPLTGKEAAFGQSSHRGILLAIDEINARGGPLGRPLQLVTEDNQSKSGDSATIARKLIARDHVVAVIHGGTSTQCLEAAPICQNAHVPLIATTATAPQVTAMGTYIFRTCFIDPFQGRVLAKFARISLKAGRASLLTSASSPFSVGLGKVFRESFTAVGGQIVGEQKYAEGDKDFRAQLTAIRTLAPDVIVAMGYYTEGGLICRQARDLGLTMPIISADGWEAPELIEIGGPGVNGAYYSSHYSSDSKAPEVQDFLKRYRAKYAGVAPDSLAPLAYDATMILADAIRRAGGLDGPSLRNALATTKEYPGVTGRTTIDANRNASKPAVILTVLKGKSTYVETIEP